MCVCSFKQNGYYSLVSNVPFYTGDPKTEQHHALPVNAIVSVRSCISQEGFGLDVTNQRQRETKEREE